MKISIWQASAATLAIFFSAGIGCSTSGQSCGGTDINSTSSAFQQSSQQCGTGTYLNSSNQCVPIPKSSAATATTLSH